MKATQPTAQKSLPASVAALANGAAKNHRVSAALVRAVIWVESRGDPMAKSSKGALGLMQLMPPTAAGLGVLNPLDPAQNVDGGTRYLAQLLRKYRGDEGLALAAYNWGPGNVDNMVESGGALKLPAQVEGYVAKVLERRNAEESAEGTHSAASPLSASARLCISCPYCSKRVAVDLDLGVADVVKQ